MSIENLKKKSLKIRKEILKTAFLCGEPAHIGGALSMVEILTVLYFKILNYSSISSWSLNSVTSKNSRIMSSSTFFFKF